MVTVGLIAAIVGFCAAPLIILSARRFGVVDMPVERSSHTVPTPRGGGIGILLGAGAGLLVSETLPALLAVAGSMAVIASIGFIDDIAGLSASVRLIVQTACAMFLVMPAGYLLVSFDPAITLAGPAAVVLTIFWLAGATNAFNFMDGINGIASLEAIIWGLTLSFLLGSRGDVPGAAFAAALAGGAAGFLPWNFPKARLFMGDVGSGTLGFALGALAVRYSRDGGAFVAAVLPFLPFMLDTTVTLIRRAANRQKLFSAHRTHFYQRLIGSGLSHAAVTALWGAMAGIAALTAIAYERLSPSVRATVLTLVVALHVVAGAAITRFEVRSARGRIPG